MESNLRLLPWECLLHPHTFLCPLAFYGKKNASCGLPLPLSLAVVPSSCYALFFPFHVFLPLALSFFDVSRFFGLPLIYPLEWCLLTGPLLSGLIARLILFPPRKRAVLFQGFSPSRQPIPDSGASSFSPIGVLCFEPADVGLVNDEASLFLSTSVLANKTLHRKTPGLLPAALAVPPMSPTL